MNQNMNRMLLRVASVALTATPVAFGVLRALQTTGNDFRYLLTALASVAVAAVIVRRGAHGAPGTMPSFARSLFALGAGTLTAAAVAFGLGARSAPAIWVVAFAFSLCATGGFALGVIAWPRSG